MTNTPRPVGRGVCCLILKCAHPMSHATPKSPFGAPTLCHALLPCAGNGSRALLAEDPTKPKQYQSVFGLPLVQHTWRAFLAVPRIATCSVVVAPGDTFLAGMDPRIRLRPVGGSSRAASVLNGLGELLADGVDAHDWVLVHDAARCLIEPRHINALIDACWNDAVGGLLALPLPDTLKQGRADRVASTVERAEKWLAQTPQMFRLGALHSALQRAEVAGFDGVTDESSAMERVGLAPLLVPGSAHNVKVTYPDDFLLADALLRSRE